jgi:hypothetical protein
MVDWQITAATFRCATVDDEVTLLVYKDWSIKCTGFMNSGKRKTAKHGKTPCMGTECQLAIEYRNKLQAEEATTAHPK